MGYYVGDIPAEPLVIEPARYTPEGETPVELTPFTDAEIEFRDPTGAAGELEGWTADLGQETITIDWPSTSPFQIAGIHELRITLTNDETGVRERLPSFYLVADTDDGWHTLDSIRNDWIDAPGYDSWLYELLAIAKQQVTDYAPALTEGTRPPLNYRHAQKMQARNLWNANRVDPASGAQGDDSFIIRPFPLDWIVKQVLRPHKAVPNVR